MRAAAAAQIKRILSANAEAPLNVECIMEDQDVRGHMNRDMLEKIIEPTIQRLRIPMEQVGRA